MYLGDWRGGFWLVGLIEDDVVLNGKVVDWSHLSGHLVRVIVMNSLYVATCTAGDCV